MIKEAIKVGLMSITRRHLVGASTAAIPVLGSSFSALAGTAADPIFAAIEAHARIYAELLALLDAQEATERALRTTPNAPALAARL